ncbi:hypothetical protein BGZ68_003106, partial [Mortierella alpina]
NLLMTPHKPGSLEAQETTKTQWDRGRGGGKVENTNEDDEEAWTKSKHGPRASMDQEQAWIKSKHGSRASMDQHEAWIRIWHGSGRGMD